MEEAIESAGCPGIDDASGPVRRADKDDIKALVGSAVKVGDDHRAILEVGVHNDNPITVCVVDTRRDGSMLTEITRKADTHDASVGPRERDDADPGIILA